MGGRGGRRRGRALPRPAAALRAARSGGRARTSEAMADTCVIGASAAQLAEGTVYSTRNARANAASQPAIHSSSGAGCLRSLGKAKKVAMTKRAAAIERDEPAM